MKKIETDILILGAGWSGLVAADLLSGKKKKVVILEKETEVGGLAKTFNFKGFKFDIGGHGLFFKDTKNLTYLKSTVNHNGLISLKRKTKVLFNNKYIDYPPNLSSLFKINKKYILNILLDMFRLNKRNQENNFEEWVKSNYGNYLYSIYFKDYTEKVWGKACNELSSSWADKRIGNSNLFKLIKGVFTGNGHCKENSHLFYYPKDGIGSLPGSLEYKITNGSCRIYKNAQLKQCSINNGKLVSLSFIYNNCLYEIFFKQIISSIPIVELIKMFPQHIDPWIYKNIDSIKYRNLILVGLIIDKKLATNWYWCYFPSKEVLFSRTHEPKFWSRDMALQDKTLLCIEIFCDHKDMYWNMKNEWLVEKVKNALKDIGLANNKEAMLDACVKKIEYAYPLYYKGFEKSLSPVKDFLGTFNNLRLIGRNGTHSYFDMEECLENVKTEVSQL